MGGAPLPTLGMLPIVQPLLARVHNGRLVLDEPTDLPEGEVVELVPLRDILDDDERARLHRAIERGMEDVRAGRTVSAASVLARLQQRANR